MDITYKKSCIAFGGVAVFIVVVIISSRNDGFQDHEYSSSREFIGFSNDHLSTITNRRLLVSPAADYNAYVGDDGSNIGDDGSETNDPVNRGCSKEDIYISQGQTSPLPNGIPTYTVQIQNICMSSCSVSDIHLSCGWFSSARLINPNVFKRISYDDCIVNNGNPISPGQTISFQYANTYPYPMSVSSASCY